MKTETLPREWNLEALEKLSSVIQYGYTVKAQQEPVGPRLLRITDIQNDAVRWDEVPFCRIKTEEKQKYLLAPNDIVFARTGATVGKSYLIRDPVPESVFASYLIRVRLKPEIAPEYVSYFFKSLDYWRQITESQAGIGQPNVNGTKLARIRIPIAPFEQQKRIVAEIEKQFSRLDESVASLKRTKANLKRYRAAVLKAAVEGKLTEDWRKVHPNLEPANKLLDRILTERRAKWTGKEKYKELGKPDVSNLQKLPQHWVWCLTDALFSFVTSGSRGWARYYSDKGPMFVRVGNLDHDSIRLDLGDVQRVKPPTGAEGTRTNVESGDILISITADVGMIAVAPSNLGEAYINQHVALARPVLGICREYLAWYLAARDGGQKQFRRLQRGATKVGLGLDNIRAVPVPLPPLAEQRQIVAEVERRLSVIDELEATVEANLTRADRLRQSVLGKAFSGKLLFNRACE